VHDVKGNANVRLRKTGSDGMPGNFGARGFYFLDKPEKKRSPVFQVIPSDSLASPIPIPFDLVNLP
jgi:hypothetical protein